MQQHSHRKIGRLLNTRAWRPLCSALIFTLSVLLGCSATADTREITMESLSPTKEHEQATEVIVHLMQRFHYSRVAVDNELSDQIYDRFLETLDPQKSFFLASDIVEFEEFRLKLDDALRKEQLDPVFTIFKRFRTRVDARTKFAQQLLNSEFDFTIDENYTFNREDATWPLSEEAADELWRKRVKNDVLTLRLAEQSNDELTKTLEERYRRMQRRVNQLAANDVFQIFINAYTLSVEPHTSYFSPRSSENFEINMSLSLEGIGTALSTENEYTVVQRVIAGGPAAMSEQIKAEDRIIGVGDGKDEKIALRFYPPVRQLVLHLLLLRWFGTK